MKSEVRVIRVTEEQRYTYRNVAQRVVYEDFQKTQTVCKFCSLVRKPVSTAMEIGTNFYQVQRQTTFPETKRTSSMERPNFLWKVAILKVKTMTVGFFASQKGITLPCKEYAEEGSAVDGLFLQRNRAAARQTDSTRHTWNSAKSGIYFPFAWQLCASL